MPPSPLCWPFHAKFGQLWQHRDGGLKEIYCRTQGRHARCCSNSRSKWINRSPALWWVQLTYFTVSHRTGWQYNDLMRCDWHVHICLMQSTHTHRNEHTVLLLFFLTCMKSALRRRGHACSCPLFTSFYNCRLKGHCEPKRIRERGIRVCVNSRTALRRCPPRHNRPLPVHIVSWSFRG